MGGCGTSPFRRRVSSSSPHPGCGSSPRLAPLARAPCALAPLARAPCALAPHAPAHYAHGAACVLAPAYPRTRVRGRRWRVGAGRGNAPNRAARGALAASRLDLAPGFRVGVSDAGNRASGASGALGPGFASATWRLRPVGRVESPSPGLAARPFLVPLTSSDAAIRHGARPGDGRYGPPPGRYSAE